MISSGRMAPLGTGRTWFGLLQRPAFWLFLIVLGIASWIAVGEETAFQRISPAGFALSWALLALYALPVLLLVYHLDLHRTHPAVLLIGSFLWGAVIATGLAGYANHGWILVVSRLGTPAFAARWTPALTAPVVEETMKVAGVLVLYLIGRDALRDPMDGFVYGATIGLGFMIVEDVFYFMAVFGGTPRDVLFGFATRALMSGLYGHALWTGLAGMGVAYLLSRRAASGAARRELLAAGMYLAALGGHFLWDSPLLALYPASPHGLGWLMFALAGAVKGLPFIGLAAGSIVLARRRERRGLEAALASRGADFGISAEEASLLLDRKRWRRARRDVRATNGRRVARSVRRLRREELRLASLLDVATSESDGTVARIGARCRALRSSIDAAEGQDEPRRKSHQDRASRGRAG